MEIFRNAAFGMRNGSCFSIPPNAGYYPEDVDVLRYLRLVWMYHGTLLVGVRFHPALVSESRDFASCQWPMEGTRVELA